MLEFILVISIVNPRQIMFDVHGPMGAWDCTVKEQEIRSE